MARSKNKKRFPLKLIITMLIAAWIAASIILRLPPISWIQESADPTPLVEETMQKPFPDKPPFRFGSRALSGICSEYGLDVQTIMQELEAFAIKAKPEWSIKRIAEQNDMEQAALFEVIRELSLDRQGME